MIYYDKYRKICYNIYTSFYVGHGIKIMNWFEHEYLVPVIIGNGKSERALAIDIRKKLGVVPCIFAERFGFGQRFSAICCRVKPMREHTLLTSLCDFAAELEEYKFPILIYSEDSAKFISAHSETLEARFVLCDAKHANELLKGADNDDYQ